jgi:alpha-L-arabinofuranosidase
LGACERRHGNPEPYKIKYWSIGNEEYLPTVGGTSGREYGRRFYAFARAMRAPSLLARNTFDQPNHVRIEQSRLQ